MKKKPRYIDSKISQKHLTRLKTYTISLIQSNKSITFKGKTIHASAYIRKQLIKKCIFVFITILIYGKKQRHYYL